VLRNESSDSEAVAAEVLLLLDILMRKNVEEKGENLAHPIKNMNQSWIAEFPNLKREDRGERYRVRDLAVGEDGMGIDFIAASKLASSRSTQR